MDTKREVDLTDKPKKSTRKLIWNNKLVFFLLLIILVGAGWMAIKFFALKRSYHKQQEQITNHFAEETSKVFSWAVRAEMLRDNREQVNQFFMNLIKEPGFKKIQLIDVANAKVIISTDKKDEGTAVADTSILNATQPRQFVNDDIMRSIVPVMGLDTRIGVLVIDRSPEVIDNNTEK